MATEHFEELHSETSTVGYENGKMSSPCQYLPSPRQRKSTSEPNEQRKSCEEHCGEVNKPAEEQNVTPPRDNAASNNRGLHNDSFHMEQVNSSSALERSLSAIYYELHTLNQTTMQLAEAVNSCAHTMYFFTRSMLDFQNEMVDTNNKISSSLRMAVRLLEENVRNLSFTEAARPSIAASKFKPSHEDCSRKPMRRHRDRGRSSSRDYTPSPCKKERY